MPLTLLVILCVILALPATRYPILALGLRRTFTITVTDSVTGTPVSGATVSAAGMSATTSSTGVANLRLKVGERSVDVSKKYYQSATKKIFVGIGTRHNNVSLYLVATGRQVPFTVTNAITGKAVADATIQALGTSANTDSSGQATLVLPVSDAAQPATVKADGYNELTQPVPPTTATVSPVVIKLTPSGRLYFLSNLSGKIDVVSANLDGSGRETIFAGSGSEDPNATVLLASRDWQYLVLLSKHDGGQYAKLFLISTSNNQVKTLDGSPDDFTLLGWSGHNFVYESADSAVPVWQPGQTLLRTYNADTGTSATLDQTSGSGTASAYAYQRIDFASLMNNRIVYGFVWGVDSSGDASLLSGKQNSIMSAMADGSSKNDLRDISLPSGSVYNYMSSAVATPQTLDIQSAVEGQPNVYYTYQYQNNSVSQSSTITDDTFTQLQQSQVTYLVSPSGQSTFWGDVRDGKNALFVGDYSASNAQQIANLSDYSPYGWFTDSYLLVQKSGSELYIMPTSGGTPLKVSDYYKPQYALYGYGGGYGGL